MKKSIKILSIIMIALLMITMITPVFAGDGTTIGGVTIKPSTDDVGDNVNTIGNKILGAIQVVGTLISVGTLMVLGIKYMMGSAEEKAEYKKTMIPYVIGAILLFTAVTLVNYVYNVSGTLTETDGGSNGGQGAIVVMDDTRII